MATNTEFNLIVDEIKRIYETDPDRAEMVCEATIGLARNSDDYDGRLALHALYGTILYMRNKPDAAMETLREAVGLFLLSEDDTRKANLCNILGEIYAKQGDEQDAFDYFLQSMHFAKQGKCIIEQCEAYRRMAQTYTGLGDFGEAISCIELGFELYQDVFEDEDKITNIQDELDRMNISAANTYCAMGRFDIAMEYAAKVDDDHIVISEPMILQSVYNMKLKIFLGLNDQSNIMRYMSLVKENHKRKTNMVENFSDYMMLFQYLLSFAELTYASVFLQIIKDCAKALKSDYFLLQYYDAQIQYLHMAGQPEQLPKILKSFHEADKRQRQKMKAMKLANMKRRSMINYRTDETERLLKQRDLLRRRSEHDELTGLPNRYCVDNYSEQIFAEAIARHFSFGVSMIDIDYFKQYNDTFGHLSGDGCLRKIAKTIQNNCIPHFCARFGGDEFVIIFFGTPTEEIEEVTETVRKEVYKLALMHRAELPLDRVTISQGVINRVPHADQTVADFIHAADDCLYEGKQTQRNKVTFGTIEQE